MGIITLTDRISVRVSAKNDTQSNDYKKATGGAIANKLGKGDVSDSLKSQLGNTKNPTITDENGDTWVSMEDMIDSGKAMNAAGAFDEKEIHEGIGDYGIIGPYASAFESYDKSNGSLVYEWSGNCYMFLEDPITSQGRTQTLYAFSKEDFSITRVMYPSSDQASTTILTPYPYTVSLYNVSYSYFALVLGLNYNNTLEFAHSMRSGQQISMQDIAAFLFGPTHTTGGSSYDWTKSDAEIEEDIRDQEEVWDVIQNAVSSSSSTAKIPVGPYVNVGHIDDSWDSTSGGSHTGGDF